MLADAEDDLDSLKLGDLVNVLNFFKLEVLVRADLDDSLWLEEVEMDEEKDSLFDVVGEELLLDDGVFTAVS